jgi:hypothetical protein
MATVYVDPAALSIGGPAGDDGVRPHPGAAAAIRHLVDAGHRVVLVGEMPELATAEAALAGDPAARAREVIPRLPEDADGWLVSSDATTCTAARGWRRLRTILVGPSVPDRGLAHRPSDVEVRDLIDAVLAVLTAEAMPQHHPVAR